MNEGVVQSETFGATQEGKKIPVDALSVVLDSYSVTLNDQIDACCASVESCVELSDKSNFNYGPFKTSSWTTAKGDGKRTLARIRRSSMEDNGVMEFESMTV